MDEFTITPTFSLPMEAVTRRIAVMGMSDSGKSNTAAVVVEKMLAAGAQVVILDFDGTWWSLRLEANGKDRGFDVPVFGGDHGDIPLDPRSGRVVADVVADRGISVVLDCSDMRKGEYKQFSTDFAENLFRLKKVYRSPMMFVVEEAETLLPQRFGNNETRMVGAFEDIAKRGRKYGIGSMWISQRPQSVNKEGLNQAEILFAHYMYGAHERAAMQEWIVHKNADVSLVDHLPYLEQGEAFVWSPRWLKTMEKVQMPLKSTYDDARTPEHGKKRIKPATLQPADLESIREMMQDAIQQAEENDPKALRRRIAELEKQLRAQKPVETFKEVPVIPPDYIDRLERLAESIDSTASHARESADTLAVKSDALKIEVEGLLQIVSGAAAKSAQEIHREIHDAPLMKKIAGLPKSENLPANQQEILNCMARLSSFGQDHPKHVLLASMAGRGSRSSQLDKELRALRDEGYILWGRGGTYSLTDRGRAQADHVKPLGTAELTEAIFSMLKPNAAKMLRQLYNVYPETIDRVTLLEMTGQGTRSSQAEKFLRQLRDMGLIEWITDAEGRPAHVAVGTIFGW